MFTKQEIAALLYLAMCALDDCQFKDYELVYNYGVTNEMARKIVEIGKKGVFDPDSWIKLLENID